MEASYKEDLREIRLDDNIFPWILRYWEEPDYFEMFCKELEACGITYRLKSEGTLILTQMAELWHCVAVVLYR